MGSVPSTVFERLLEAVAAAESAPLMEQLNVLLNAGHSPLSLARQMVRYLRNALMAKLGGEQTELLQISADERARAARTALLFTEEELTRNLQIVLRTFDDLNYRQEQRFHLELGLLKLIHAQRLLPIEELLSGVAGGAGAEHRAAPSSAARGLQRSRGRQCCGFGFGKRSRRESRAAGVRRRLRGRTPAARKRRGDGADRTRGQNPRCRGERSRRASFRPSLRWSAGAGFCNCGIAHRRRAGQSA